MAKKLPQTVFILRVGEGTRDEYLSVGETMQGHADLDENRLVGRYELVELLEVSARIEGKPVHSRLTRKKL